MNICNRSLSTIHIVIILAILIMVTYFSSWNSAGQDKEADQSDEYIYRFGGPYFGGARDAYIYEGKGLLDQKHRDVNGFILGVDSFHEADQIFGEAQKWHSGDAATSESKICFLSQDRNQKVIIVFASNSEMSSGKVDSVRFIQGEVYFLKMCHKTSVEPKKY
ncbi:MAG: hypothetical protein JXA50_05700 [Deltaproteobacteria bacterium]|nr:hypothetical protein [Deltaproteobacteria bacterium]